MEIVSTGIIQLDEQFDELIDYSGTGSDTQDMLEEQFCNFVGLEEHNPFQQWAE